MDDQLRSENRSTLATLAAAISFPYIWLGLFLLLSLMYGADFFGRGFEGGLVAGLLCLGLLNPIVPGLVSSFVARPIFFNLLGRELVSSAGCLVGLGGLFLTGLSVLYFLTRDLEMALILFLAAPLVGGLLATVISLAGRGGLSLPSRRRAVPPTSWQVRKPERRVLPGKRERPALPPSSSSRLSRPSSPRRSERVSKPSRRTPRPPKRR